MRDHFTLEVLAFIFVSSLIDLVGSHWNGKVFQLPPARSIAKGMARKSERVRWLSAKSAACLCRATPGIGIMDAPPAHTASAYWYRPQVIAAP
jgi:hypothetical protein